MQFALHSNPTDAVKALDAIPSHALDDLAFLAAQSCQTPMALITVGNQDHQQVKSNIGWPLTAPAYNIIFCTYTSHQVDLLIVPDAQTDERFAADPLVTGEPLIRFYAGVPLRRPDGFVIGTLGVLDRVPRALDAQQQQALTILSRQVVAQLELQRHTGERQQTEKMLHETKERLRALAEKVNAIAWEADLVTQRFTYVGPQAVKMLGYPIEAWYRDSFWIQHLHPEDRDKAIQFARTHFALESSIQRDNYEFEYRMVANDGRVVWLRDIVYVRRQADGTGQLLGFTLNITEPKRAEEELRRIHELYRNAIIAADAVPYLREYQSDSFIFMGEAIQQMTGYTVAEMTPALLDAICTETVMRGATEGLSEEEAIRRTRLGEFHQWRCDSRLRTRTGEQRWITDASIEIYAEDGKPAGSIGILMDITDRKQVEMDLQESNYRLAEALTELEHTHQQLVQQERLRAVGTMASGIAHDFNNMLAPILGFTELLLLRPESRLNQEKLTYYLQAILLAAQSAATVVSRLREFYRFRDEAEQQQPVDLHQVVEQAMLLTQPHWKDQALARGVPVHVKADLQPVPLIKGNKAELQEMLTNLILNAVDALLVEGEIMIRVFAESGPHGRNPAGQRSGAVVLEISDTGMGMDEETRRRCFEPFFSTKGKQGTGLGLATVYGTVQRHQGSIEVESSVGKGTTFRLALPIPLQAPEFVAQMTAQSLLPLHILVVDDDPIVRDVIIEYLQHEKHSTEIAANGWEGLEKFRAGHFDLVITDRAMPKLNGDGLAAAIKEVRIDTPVILLTGFGEFMNAVGDLPLGVDCVMRKPFTLNTLQQTIANVMEKR